MGLPEPIQGDLGARPVDAAQPTWDTFDYALLDLARVTDKTGGVGRPLLAQSGQTRRVVTTSAIDPKRT